MPPPVPHASSLLMPTAWSLLLRLLIQLGFPPKQLRTFCKQPGTPKGHDTSGEKSEEDLWAYLPANLRAAWERSARRMSSAEAKV